MCNDPRIQSITISAFRSGHTQAHSSQQSATRNRIIGTTCTVTTVARQGKRRYPKGTLCCGLQAKATNCLQVLGVIGLWLGYGSLWRTQTPSQYGSLAACQANVCASGLMPNHMTHVWSAIWQAQVNECRLRRAAGRAGCAGCADTWSRDLGGTLSTRWGGLPTRRWDSP